MTFLHKLAKRLSLASYAGLLLLSACSEATERELFATAPSGLGAAQAVAVTVSPRVGSIKPGEVIQFAATGRAASGASMPVEVDWAADGGTITGNGAFTAGQHGQFRITARVRSAPHLTDSALVAVFTNPSDILLLSVSPDSTEITAGEGLQLEANAHLASGTTVAKPPVRWSATGGRVDGNGWYVPSEPGHYRIEAEATGGIRGSALVLVRPSRRILTGLQVVPSSLALAYGGSVTFGVTASFADGGDGRVAVSWSASGGTVDGSGTFTAGSTTGNFLVVARDRTTGVADTARVSISEPAMARVSISPARVTITSGGTQQFTAQATLEDGSVRPVGVTWAATGGQVQANGLFTAGTTVGQFRVIATVPGSALADTAIVTVASAAATVQHLMLNPAAVSVPAGESRQFTVSAVYADGSVRTPLVTWSATGGSISAGGLFTAGTAEGAFRVIATEASGTADTSAITVVAPVLKQLALNPSAVSLVPGASRRFEVAARWSDGGTRLPDLLFSAEGGRVSADGEYTAGSEAGTWRVIVRQAGGTVADTSLVTIAPPPATLVALTLSPRQAELQPGAAIQPLLSARWSDGGAAVPAVRWSATGGSIDDQGRYVAGAAAGQFRIVATHTGGTVADSMTITISSAAPSLGELTVSPQRVSLQLGGQRAFTVTGRLSDGSATTPAVRWSTTGGSITESGLFVAGNLGIHRVIATQVNGALADTAEVEVTEAPQLTRLVASPDSATLKAGQVQQFTAVAEYSNGSTAPAAATWAATGGTISAGGLYAAGASAGSFRVVASAGGLADTIPVRVTVPATVTGFVLTPASVRMTAGATQQFAAEAAWSDGVTRSVTVTYAATGGTVSPSGLFTAGQAAGTFLVIASCGCGPADTSTVTVAVPPTVTALRVSPDSMQVAPGGTLQLTATAVMSDGSTSTPSVTWSATGGAVSASGLFTAPATAGSYTVIATHAASGKTGSALVRASAATEEAAVTAPELPRVFLDTRYIRSTGRSIVLGPGGSLQSAINSARCGDEILLSPGSVYEGSFTLPAKGCAGSYVTIMTQGFTFPESQRVTQSAATGLAKISTLGSNAPALQTAPGASFYRIIGVVITAADSVSSLNTLVRLGSGVRAEQGTLDQVPRNIILDRVMVIGRPDMSLTRCIQLHTASSAIIDSYIGECHGRGTDTQAIVGWNGPGPYKIENNYLEGAGENVMFGGADPKIAGMVPSDIVFRRNHVAKPLEWRGRWTVKNLFELKIGKRVLIEENVFENVWVDAQVGRALVIKSVNQEGTAPWSETSDVTIRGNVVRNAQGGAIVLAANPEAQAAVPLARVMIANNLFFRLGSKSTFGGSANAISVFGGRTSGVNNVQVVGNTIDVDNAVMLFEASAPNGQWLVYKDNIAAHGAYGVWGDGGVGMTTINNQYPTNVVAYNVFFGGSRFSAAAYPSATKYYSSADLVRFTSYQEGNFSLSSTSPVKGWSSSGRDPGVDWSVISAVIRDVVN